MRIKFNFTADNNDYSFGGLSTQEFTYRHSEKTEAFILISSFPKIIRTLLLAGMS
ncbi:hypothetical protein MHA01_22290 [Marinococcus halophilus]|uniref:Uncharacterized protein n=1 Tax=Marinococcus halophilus TaxID=1371 RepID=A0A510Y7I4_MARHA|nr:hypothetical protein MHA01_22290 [Marinococcus halophilus]